MQVDQNLRSHLHFRHVYFYGLIAAYRARVDADRDAAPQFR